jgi:hypothetical protein
MSILGSAILAATTVTTIFLSNETSENKKRIEELETKVQGAEAQGRRLEQAYFKLDNQLNPKGLQENTYIIPGTTNNSIYETKNLSVKARIHKLEQSYKDFTNPTSYLPPSYSPKAECPCRASQNELTYQTNLTSQTEYTNTPTRSQRTPAAIRYAEKSNQTQATQPKGTQ